MKTIYKYKLEVTRRQIIDVPNIAKVLHVGLDPWGDICVWIELWTEWLGEEKMGMKIRMFNTGGSIIPDEGGYSAICHIGTVAKGDYVRHFYREE